VYVVVTSPPETVVYVGRTKRALARRLREFYRHVYGDKRPHRGGQEVLTLTGERWVYWCATDNPREVERILLDTYKAQTGSLPSANRRLGDSR
jgi:hypothetical protein